ncbi:MAG: DUF3284 domain-containing protein, partial [Traorella sp.]
MEVKIVADVDAKAYFDFVISTIQTSIDISECEDKTLKKGLQFERAIRTGMFKKEMAQVKILDYTYPKVIEMEYKCKAKINVMKYLVLPKGKDKCEVTYTENTYDPTHKLKTLSSSSEKSYQK